MTNWTTQPPTEPGLYWGYIPDEEPGILVYVRREGLYAVSITGHEGACTEDFTHFRPLEIPEPPMRSGSGSAGEGI